MAPSDGQEATRGHDELYRYLVRRTVPPEPAPSDGEETLRGPLRTVGKKVVEVVVFPLIDPVFGRVGRSFAANWEQSCRPYMMRSITRENYRNGDPAEIPSLGPADWRRLAGGRALLLLHGTFSRAHEAFAALPPPTVKRWEQLYGGRVFAFDHFTLSHSPRENVECFLRQLPDEELALELDIIAHSRGGLVARVLAEKQSEFSMGSRILRVNRVVHVGTPNAGTPLTNTDHMNDLIESYTNILKHLPDSTTSLVLDGLLLVAKQLAARTVEGLEGLQAMLPGGDFLRGWLRGPGGPARYHVVTSNYRPSSLGLLSWAADRVFNHVFSGAHNDLVVPTASVYDPDGTGLFPIPAAQQLVLGPEA
jgi:pimeloyl-ACP methyl ester carboxylesterase